MAFNKKHWEDLPDQTTPVDATELNRIEDGIKYNDDRLEGISSAGNMIVDSIRSKNMAMKNNNFVKNSQTLEDISLVKLSANKTYCISYYTNLNSSNTYWYFKDANKNNIFNFGINNSTSRVSKDFTPTQDIYFVGAFLNDASTEIYDFQIEESDSPTIYAPYQNLNGAEILWQNANINSQFLPQDVNIPNLNKFTYYEIVYKQHATAQNYMQNSGKIPIGQNCCLGGGILRINAAPRFWSRFVDYSSTKLTFSAGYYETSDAASASTANDIIIPYQILGYK